MTVAEVFLGLLAVVLIYFVIKAFVRNDELESSKKSQSVVYGKISEQFMPFMSSYKDNPQHFRFIGSPIDGVQFNEDNIVFVEFKTNKSKLSPKQEGIKKLVEEKKVEWRTITLK